jgi:protein gp37
VKDTKIAWCDHTFNPWWGCTKVDALCKHCYAESLAKRRGQPVWGADAPRRAMSDDHWKQPAKWNREAERAGVRARVFCASMADVFEVHATAEVNAWLDSQRLRLAQLIDATPWLDWLLLTKRPENIGDIGERVMGWTGDAPANVWLGTSAGTQESADTRVLELMQLGHSFNPAGLFVSCEPMLEPVDFAHLPYRTGERTVLVNAFTGGATTRVATNLRAIDVVIIGGESGGRARRFDFAWARAVIAQTAGTNCHAFFKQAGANTTDTTERDPALVQVGEPAEPQRIRFESRSGADIDEMPADLRMQSWPPSRRIATGSSAAVMALRTFAGRYPELGSMGRAVEALERRAGKPIASMSDDEVIAVIEGRP